MLKVYGVLAAGEGDDKTVEFQYDVTTKRIQALGWVSSPPLGPRVISVNHDGSIYLSGWTLNDPAGTLLAQFPNASGVLQVGSHAVDSSRGLVYAQLRTKETSTSSTSSTTSAPAAPIMEILDADNLAVLDRLQLAENLAGRSVLSADRDTMYSISDSGVTFLPVGALNRIRRVASSVEDLVFRGNFCDRKVATQQLTIYDAGGNSTDFTLSTTTAGISINPASGVTPATVTIQVDPNVFQNQKGTAQATIKIQSAGAVNVPRSVRVLINSREPDQRGTFVNVPGKLVDILADPVRDRIFVLRQDKNQVLVFDANTFTLTATLKTGNTPTQMAFTFDRQQLLVGSDNSQIIHVFDLDTLEPRPFIRMPGGHYPRSVAASGRAILVANRVAGPKHVIDRVDLATRTAVELATLGVYENKIHQNTVLAPSPNGGSILITQPDGNLMLYNANVDTFTVARKDFTALSGAYAASSFDQYVVGGYLFNSSVVPVRQFETATGAPSGFVFVDQGGLRTTAADSSSAGTIQRVTLDSSVALPASRMAEAPLVGTLDFAFTRTLATLYSRKAIVSLTISGFTVLPWNYDAPAAAPQISGIVNAADGSANIAPGSLVSIYGQNLSPVSVANSEMPLPTALGGSCLTVNGLPVPFLFVSPAQINAQMPYQVEGNVTLILRTPGGTSDNFYLLILPAAPTVFRTGGGVPGVTVPTVIRASNNQLVTLANPIHKDEVIVIYLAGMGNTNPVIPAGVPAPSDPPTPIIPPSVQLGGADLPILFAGLTPGQIGVYQINAKVPWWAPDGMSVPLTVSQGGFSASVNVRVVK